MAILEELQKNYSAPRIALNDAERTLQTAKAALQNLNRQEEHELRILNGQALESRKNFFIQKRNKLSEDIAQTTAAKKLLKAQLENLALQHLEDLNPINRIGELNDAFPILMFPLRLETRFKSNGTKKQLWLRVYPDDCNINRKEELLSESELMNVRSFWVGMWKANNAEADQRGAWRSIVNSHGSGRAAYIIERYKPKNDKSATDASKKILVAVSSLILTDAEHIAATNYWAAIWMAAGNKLLYDDAFNVLKSETGDAKAVEIIEKYVPENISDEVPADLQIEHVILLKMDLPSEEEYTTSQTSWTQAPKAIALPDRFVAVRYTGENKTFILFPNAVKENLQVGPDPSLPADEQIQKDGHEELIVNEELKWMVDFEAAIAAGMGIKIDLSDAEAANGFDKLFVVGLGVTSTETENQARLEKLLNDHFQSTDGFGLLKQGTPTNNTEDQPSGYSWTDDPDESYDYIFKKTENFTETDEPSIQSDGQKLADALGINPDILKTVPNANGKDQLEANAMNTALFPATLGYFMEEMMHPLFTDRDIEATKLFFSHFVSGRGPVPAIRIGKQPYGILPVSVYSKMQFPSTQNVISDAGLSNFKTPYFPRLHNLLMKIDKSWDSMLTDVAYIGKDGDPHQILLDVIGLHSGSVEFHQRYAQSIQQLYNQYILQFGISAAGDIASFVIQRGKKILEELNIDIKETSLPILEKYFLSNPNLLSGALVDDVPASEEIAVRDYTPNPDKKNYIKWLRESAAEEIRTENFGGNSAPDALLYMLLKHALTLAQADAATNLLIKNNTISSKKVFHDPDFIHVEKEGTGKSKFEHLYSPNASITGNENLKLSEYIYKPEVLKESAETKRLRETLDALKILETTPTARLERLLTEHIDCCNYRIDAWKTGLVNYKLTEQRTINTQNNKPSKGLHLGAYGWLLDVRPENKTMTDVVLSSELENIFNRENTTSLQTDNKNLGYIHAPSLNQAAAAAILRNAYDSNKDSGTENPFAINLTSDRVRIASNFLEGMRNGQSLSALLGYQFERGLHDKYNLVYGEVDQFIYPLRKAFPLVADNLNDTKSDEADNIENIEANNVIDGLKLINHVLNASVKTYPFGLPASLNLPTATATQANAVNTEVKRILEINDAISDLVISEQVYQVVQGNFERASGNAEAFSKGSYPPDIDIINTPRSGVVLTQRMAIQFDANAPTDKSPYYDEGTSIEKLAMTPRAKAEPAVNKWLATVLPDPENVLCAVEYSSPVIAKTKIKISQKDLGLQPIDLLYVFNLDTEQSMAELDDRIVSYCRYELFKKTGFELFIHPKTEIKINYTQQIDEVDKIKVSFFELAALIKSLRKILIGSRFLSAAAVTLSEGKAQTASQMDDVQLDARITALKEDLKPLKAEIETIITSTKSITGLTELLKASLSAHITEATKLETLISKFRFDLIEYFVDPANESALLDVFENSVISIGNITIIADLKSNYKTLLNDYANDFLNYDTLVESTTMAFLELARYDNTQTGTGFMQQEISSVYKNVFSKLDILVKRWNKKSTDFNTLISEYDATGIEAEQIELLQKAERIISAKSTFPVPALTDYKNLIDVKNTSFTVLLMELKLLKTNTAKKIVTFIETAESTVKNIGDYDVLSFDTENNRNDLKAEKLQMALLKEDMVLAHTNVLALITDKISGSEELITGASVSTNTDRVIAFQNAAKKMIGEEALVVPLFKLDEALANEFEKSYSTSSALLGFVKNVENRIFPVEDWLGGISRVRDKVHDWENISCMSGAFVPDIELTIVPLQFPYTEGDRWVAMKFRDETKDGTNAEDKFRINNDKLLYTAHFATTFDKSKQQCGIIIDEWTEVIPANEETTGIAFHYDQPNSEPAQTMLLVVPPYFTGTWKWEHLIESMEETLEMAKKRAIEPAQIEKSGYAQFLPTTMMAVTLHMITAATNLALNNKTLEN